MIANSLLKYVDFSKEELETIASKFKRQTIGKNDFFLTKGQVCKKAAFVENGSLTLSQTLEDGNQQILDFFTAGDMISDYYSFLKDSKSEANIRAHKASTLLVISKTDVELLLETIPNYQKLGRLLAEEYFMQLAEKIKGSSLPPLDRYERLVEQKPVIFESFPQYMIASYLGIRPEWLSRVRAQR